ncbi:MAG: hypothetical protein U1E69_22215 [Tabrizicola sp.]|uniref:hypothetical protein n=1 Tax=Tabrizicola sp. TaxID=2005166 RepID=UPI002ABB41E8|nr:hypothetical protein [Tabrizicola sp.]MDZ4089514.1 hypothetical protein [Tabrizicola sp.]
MSSLDPATILATAEGLERRVVERSADRGLAQVAIEAVTLDHGFRAKSRRCSLRFGGCGCGGVSVGDPDPALSQVAHNSWEKISLIDDTPPARGKTR